MKTIKVVCHECYSINLVDMNTRSNVVPCTQCQVDLDDPFPLEVTDEICTTYLKENDTAILLDFYSTTCGPCMAMYEDYEDAALGFGLKVKFLKINADKHQEVASQYRVSSLPTIIAFKEGKEINRVSKQLSAVELALWAQNIT